MSSPGRDRGQRDSDEELKRRYPATHGEQAFRRGYERGRAYYRRLLADRRSGPRNAA